MTRPRSLLLSALLVALAAPGVYAQDSIDQLADMIKTASSSADPSMAFLTGFQSMDDFDADAAEVREAIRRAGVPIDGPAAIFASTTRLTKNGNRISMKRSQADAFTLESGAGVKYGKSVAFDLTQGFVGTLGSSDLERLGTAQGNYLHLGDVDGIEVRKAGGDFYNLYEMYRVTEEDGMDVAHVKAGTWFYKEWARVELGDDAEVTASASSPEVLEEVSSESDRGLPVPTSLTSIDESTPMIRETVPSIRDTDQPEDAEEAGVYVATITPAPSEDTVIVPETDLPTETIIIPEETEQQTPRDDRNGLLETLETVNGPNTTQGADLLHADRNDGDDTDAPVSEIARTQTNQAPSAGDASADRPLESLETVDGPDKGLGDELVRRDADEIADASEIDRAQIAQTGATTETDSPIAMSEKPIEDRLEDLEAREAGVLNPSDAVKAEDDVVDAAAADDVKGSNIPVVIPEPEDKAAIDAGVDEAKTEMDAEGDRLAELIELIKKDREEAERRMTVRIRELDERNKVLEARIAEMSRQLEGRDATPFTRDYSREDALSDLEARYRRNNPASNQGRARNVDRYGRPVNGPRSYGDYRDTRGNPGLDNRRYDNRRYDNRGGNPGFDNRGRGRYEAPISGPNGNRYDTRNGNRGNVGYDRNGRPITNQDDTSHMSGLQRLFLKLLDGVKKGLDKKYANETERNMRLNAMALAGANGNNYANNRGYVDNRMRNAMVNSNLGRTAGINSYNSSPNFLYAPPETTTIVPYGGNTYGQPNNTPGLYYSNPTVNVAPLNTGALNIPLGGGTPIIRR